MRERVVALVSGGVDSAILCHLLAREGAAVLPLYVRQGYRWEAAEFAALVAFLRAAPLPGAPALAVSDVPVAPLLRRDAAHFALGGGPVPAPDDADGSLELPGRNLLLVPVALLHAAQHGAATVALGTLDANPYPDAAPGFLDGLAQLGSAALGRPLRVVTPLRGTPKAQFVQRFADLPLHLTLSCVAPGRGAHCGRCAKCAERRDAFAEAGIRDATAYAA